MRRLIVLLMVLVALLMAQTAQATLTNEILNGNFNSVFTNWENPTPGPHSAFSIFTISGTNYAGLAPEREKDEGAISQIADDTAGNGWNPSLNNKWWQFKVKAYVTTAPLYAYGEAYLFYWNDNNTPPAALGNPDDPHFGWIALVAGEPEEFPNNPQDGTVTASGNYAWTGTILGFQPKYFAVALEAQDINKTGAIGFTNVELYGECFAVPVPPAVWLFGSGLLGLIGLRRKFKA